MSEVKSANLISLDVAARLLMVSVERVRQLAREGYIERPKPGRTTIVSAVQGYVRFLKDEDRKSVRAVSKARVADARAAEVELRIAERKRALITDKEAVLLLRITAEIADKELRRIPAKTTTDARQRRLLRGEVERSRINVTKRRTAATAFIRSGDEARLGVLAP